MALAFKGTRFKGGSWRFRIKMTLPNGTKINREKAGFKSSYEAYQARIEEIGRIKLTNFVEKRITLNEMYGLFLEESATKQKSFNTVLRYNSIYNNHIRSGLGEMYVGRIQPLDITHFLNEKAEQYKTDYPLSMYNFFLVLFDFARKHKYINEDIMALVESAWGLFGAAFGPVVILSLFWKRFNYAGAVAGILAGAAVDILRFVFLASTGVYEIVPGFAAGLIAAVVVTLLTKKPSDEVIAIYEKATDKTIDD